MIVISYLTARISLMLDYALTWGQLLDFIKIYFARKVNKSSYDQALRTTDRSPLKETSSLFEDENGVFDYMQKESKLFRLINCVYCIGVWVSLLVALSFAIVTGYWSALIIIPILTNHMIEL